MKRTAMNAGMAQWNDIDTHNLRKTFEEVLDKPLLDGIKVREIKRNF
ncbi:MAG: hypothetical protein QXQ02_01440 [Halobacteria archaeon]